MDENILEFWALLLTLGWIPIFSIGVVIVMIIETCHNLKK